MLLYILKFSLCLGILLAFYHLILEREKMHEFNRFYLLGSILLSFFAPMFIIYVEAVESIEPVVPFVHTSEKSEISFFDQYLTPTNILFAVYAIVVLILFIRFLKNLFDISKKIRKNTIVLAEHAKFVLVEDRILPHTFWNFIFINKDEYETKKIEDELFTHEIAHVTQRHTIDVLIIEVLRIVFWFNPLLFLLKKAIQLNHEFLADDSVISSHNNISRYQNLLLNKAAWKNEYYLASNLNYSLTKKRLLMMKTSNSRKIVLLKKLAVLPLAMAMVFAFAQRVEAQTKNKKIQIVEVETKATNKQMNEYKEMIKKGEKTNIFKHKDVKRMRYLYSLMSESQKKTVKNIYDLLPPPPPPAKPKLVVKGKRAPVKVKRVKDTIYVVKGKHMKAKKAPLIIEVIEDVPHKEELIEVREVQEIEVEEIIEEVIVDGKNSYADTLNQTKNIEGEVIYYLNGRKVSTKKAMKVNPKDIEKVHVNKSKDGSAKVYIYTK